MYQSYLYFEANTCLQEMAHWRRCAVRTTHTKINSVWLVPHLPNFNHHVLKQTLVYRKWPTGEGVLPEIDFRYELKAGKVMVDFKFDALYS